MEREDYYGKYWEVMVTTANNPDSKYTVWLLDNLGFTDPRSWEWSKLRFPWKSSAEYHTVHFRKAEDALAFKLKFGICDPK